MVLFFTDGLPNGLTADFAPKRVAPALCDTLNLPLVGWISQTSGFVNDPSVTHGLFRPLAAGPSDPQDGSNSALIPALGCQFVGNPNDVSKDFSAIPDQDAYGNLTNPPNPYKSTLYPQATGAVTLSGINRATQVAAASFNAADQAAQRMRAGSINNIVPLVYTISLLNNPAEPLDPEFMKRVSNTRDSLMYDSTKPVGLYIDTQHKDELQSAFLRIASEILRLSK